MLEVMTISPAGGKTTVNGQRTFLNSETWTVPNGVHNISIVCVGGGESALSRSGMGGDLRWMSSFDVTPGQVLKIQAGPTPRPGAGIDSFVALSDGTHILVAKGGASTLLPSTYTNLPLIGGGNGGVVLHNAMGGGGAGGYSGSGGNGSGFHTGDGSPGRGGGGGGGSYYNANSRDWAGGGGGVGIHGIGESGAGGRYNVQGSTGPSLAGGRVGSVYRSSDIPNSDVATDSSGTTGGQFGGGCGYFSGSSPGAGAGAVRIIWGPGREFPDKLTLNM